MKIENLSAYSPKIPLEGENFRRAEQEKVHLLEMIQSADSETVRDLWRTGRELDGRFGQTYTYGGVETHVFPRVDFLLELVYPMILGDYAKYRWAKKKLLQKVAEAEIERRGFKISLKEILRRATGYYGID